MKNKLIMTVLSLGLLVSKEQAHHIWIEQDDQQAKIYFGEFNLNLREASPGLLDKLAAPTARLINKGVQTLALQKTAQAFVINARAAAGEAIVVEEANYPAYDKQVEGRTVRAIYRPAARYISDFQAQTPQLTLDAVPTGKLGELKVYFHGQPLAKAKAIVIAESGWTQELSSDAAGVLQLTLPWQSRYAIEVMHTDATPGMRGAEAYALATYVTTVSVVRKIGLPSTTPPTAVAPTKMQE